MYRGRLLHPGGRHESSQDTEGDGDTWCRGCCLGEGRKRTHMVGLLFFLGRRDGIVGGRIGMGGGKGENRVFIDDKRFKLKLIVFWGIVTCIKNIVYRNSRCTRIYNRMLAYRIPGSRNWLFYY